MSSVCELVLPPPGPGVVPSPLHCSAVLLAWPHTQLRPGEARLDHPQGQKMLRGCSRLRPRATGTLIQNQRALRLWGWCQGWLQDTGLSSSAPKAQAGAISLSSPGGLACGSQEALTRLHSGTRKAPRPCCGWCHPRRWSPSRGPLGREERAGGPWSELSGGVWLPSHPPSPPATP